ncbi:MAG: M13-type metalloendopeptidase [Kofleriaceae bacterium]
MTARARSSIDQGRLNHWWSPEDLAKLQARGQCVVDQCDHYFIEPELHHNGKLVLAFRAFQKAKQQAPAPTLDGFTPDQQFFIARGQSRGDAIRPETQRLMIRATRTPLASSA